MPPACPSLPLPCSGLLNVGGIFALRSGAIACATALGGLNVGSTAACLNTNLITSLTSGAGIVSCLKNSLLDRCITALPGACASLQGLVGNVLSTKLHACTSALGPLATGTAAVCFNTGLTKGNDIVACLLTNLALGAGTDPSGNPCVPTQPPSLCVSELPGACLSLQELNGPPLAEAIPGCQTALGKFSEGPMQCFNAATPGSTVVACLQAAFIGVCIEVMPDSCTLIGQVAVGQLVELQTRISACANDLGPLLNAQANVCLDTSTAPTDIVSCLSTALFVGGG
ncbi:hypothetical protein CDD83_9310 [Cordyceps sp. RAO-2017]|nr:hypothetical protein CDD83_9310 [Cordyceps sp. RAO-2017]